MKVVLFCGGLGLRLRDYSEQIPKPMVPIGYRPILWHVMKYFAHFGHRDFILCLGYRGDVIRQFFLNYNECLSNDFVLSHGGKRLQLANSDIHDWNITFAETGMRSNIGQRLLEVRKYLGDDEMFLASYSDGLTDLDFDAYLSYARRRDKVATFVSVKPNQSYHCVKTDENGDVTSITEVSQAGIRINAGYFVLKREMFDYMEPGDELVVEPFQRLIRAQQLAAYEYDGFFASMDTFKDKQQLDKLNESGHPPWELWSRQIKTDGPARHARPAKVRTMTGRLHARPQLDRAT